jgi:hypothetical protein
MTKPESYYLTVKNAAFAAHTTPKKMLECLTSLGVRVNDKGTFGLDTLLYAVRANCDPARSRAICDPARSRAICHREMQKTLNRAFAPAKTGKRVAVKAER